MHVKAQLSSYEKLPLSVTVTGPVEDWRAALKQLDSVRQDGWIAWPLSGLYESIEKMLADLDKTHFAIVSNGEATP